jgi:MFS family permease
MGRGAIFWLPAALFLVQLILLNWLSHRPAAVAPAMPDPEVQPPRRGFTADGRAVNPHGFLKMAWLANPFAYVAMNTLLAVMPGIAQKLDLSPTRVGLYCSIWFFARFGAFAFLWKWTGWQYRFRWLLMAFVALIISFMFLLLARELWLFALAQVFFGFSAGLIYYSSLYYSMDVGEASAEHGGLHEAAIGAGICAGPAVGAASLQFLPHQSNSGAFAVSGLLLLGLGGLLVIWRTQRAR